MFPHPSFTRTGPARPKDKSAAKPSAAQGDALRVRGCGGGHGVPFGKLRAGFRLRRAIRRNFAQDDKLKVTPGPPFMPLVLEGRQIASRLGEKVPGFAVAFEAVAGFFLGRHNGG